jgi:ankyrin repeat protein
MIDPFWAIEIGFINLLEEWIDKNRLCINNIRHRNGFSLLEYAIFWNNENIVKLLIDKGAIVINNDSDIVSPLHLACSNYASFKIVKLLLEKGTPPSDFVLQISLYHAVKRRNIKLVKLLLSYGAKVNHIDFWGQTPLHLSVYEGDIEMIKLLLEKGANVNFCDYKQNKTPLHLICSSTLLSKEKRIIIAKLLVEKGANINACDEEGNNVLHLSSIIGEEDLVIYFRKKIKLQMT